MADLANIAAATSAGYAEIVLDRGSGANPAVRYEVTLEKQLVGGRQSGATWRAFGQGSSQANAETQDLANLNGKRALRYAGANDAYGELDMVSFGPQIEAPHSPDERVSIPTVERFWRLLAGIVDEFSAAFSVD